MLSSLLNGASLSDWFVQILYRIPAVLIAISLHEYAHALMAHLLGDNTAKMYGRLTPNPAAHFDIVGALCMLFVGFGWAKPVPFDYRNLKKPKRDTALIAFAGPLMNFIVAAAALLLYAVLIVFFSHVKIPSNARLLDIILQLIIHIYSLNLGLMVFNLIPIPPLDGSKVLFSFLPASSYKFILTYERYGSFILLAALFLGALDVPLNFLVNLISSPLEGIAFKIIAFLM